MSRPTRPLSFRLYLAGMTTAALIPVIVLAAAVVARDAALQRRELRTVLRGNALAVSTMLDTRVADEVAALKALAGSPRMRSGAFGLFLSEAQVLLAGYQRWQSVVLVSATGQPLVVAQAGPPRSLASPSVDPATTGGWDIPTGETVTAMPPAHPGGTPKVQVGVPVDRNGEVVGALWACLAPDSLSAALASQRLVSRWASVVVTEDGIVLAATDPRLVGRPFAYAPWREIRARRLGVITGRAPDGIPVYVAFDHSRIAPWTIADVAPITSAFPDPAELPAWAWALAGAVAFPLLLVGFAGSFLQRRMQEVAATAVSISRDEPLPPAPPTGVREIDAVHAALRHARQALAERAESRERLHQAEVALLHSQRSEAISHLSSAIAHDFGNLALVISGRLELIRRAVADERKVARLIEPALELTRAAGRMMSDLARTMRTQVAPPGPAQLNELVSEIADLLRRAAGRGVRTEFSLQPDLWRCMVNPTMLRSALFNLVVNARAAMPDGGTLRIHTGNTTIPSGAATRDEPPPGEYVLLTVTDTGAGIPAETLSRIFDPFFTTRRNGRGTGLGLAIVQEFVQQSGGHIRVASEIGIGTAFFLYFPRSDAETDGPSSHESAATPVTPDRV